MPAVGEKKPFLRRSQAAARYDVGLRTLDRWIREGRLPKIQITRRTVLLDPIACDEAIRRFTVEEVTK
jgi:predicted site-specific integrase-resolvase